MFWNTWTSFTLVSQNYETMKRKSEAMRPVSQKLVSAFFFVCNGKNETNLHKLWNWREKEKKWNHENNLDTRFIGLFYVAQWGFNRNLLYFFFFFIVSYHMKLAGIGFRFFWLKNETGWWFHDFMEHKNMNPPGSVGKKNETDGTRLRFHNFMPK